MNITLSADKQLVDKTRAYAKRHGSSMNQMIRDFMERVAGAQDGAAAAADFEIIAREYAGRSSKGYTFNRDEVHRRGDT